MVKQTRGLALSINYHGRWENKAERDRRNNSKDVEMDDEINRCIQRMTGLNHKTDKEFMMILQQG